MVSPAFEPSCTPSFRDVACKHCERMCPMKRQAEGLPEEPGSSQKFVAAEIETSW